jgi:hypothetical protein
METKICTSCKEEKLISDFYQQKDRKNGSSSCRKCFDRYCINRWKKRKIEAVNYKGNSCVDCGIKHPDFPAGVFEFHHIDPNEKDVDWTKLRLRSWDKITHELDKCVMLCANCHRMRHSEE